MNDECKMQSDSIQLSTSGHIREVNKQATAQASLVKPLRCSNCALIFKSKVYLFDHLNKVHELDVDTALREAGLKYAGTDRTKSKSTGKPFKCQNCDFKTTNWFVLNQHEKQCEKTENPNLSETPVISEKQEAQKTVFSTKQYNEVTETGETSSVVATTSALEAQCTPTLSKDLKTYKRPSQTPNKEPAASCGPEERPHANISDEPKGTLILQENSSSSSYSSGVFKVTAMPVIDMSERVSQHFLHDHHLLISDLRPPKPKEELKEAFQNSLGKRTNNQSSRGPPVKKSKPGEEKKHPETENESKQPSGSTDFSFEVSDDEEEKLNLGNGDPQRAKVYFCKHCDHSDVNFRRVSSHYQNDHPYVKYKIAYINSSNDQSATFRCLECPVEFLSTVDLKWHYMEKHPDAPDIFKMKPSEFNLVFKCFECQVTTNASKTLRQHYKEQHPLHPMDNSLLFCRYSVTQCQEDSSSLKAQEKTSSLERSEELSPVKASPPCEQVQSTPSPQHPPSKGSDVVLHKCNNCEFVHKSVVVMHVHYKKKHPNEAVAIDKIRQLTYSVTPKKESLKKAEDKPESPEKISLRVPEHKAETSKDHSASPQTKKAESAEVESKEKPSPTKPHGDVTSGKDDLSSGLTDEMFYCQFCDYSNPNLRSVVNHCCSKHSAHGSVNQGDIVRYTAEKRKRQLDSKASEEVSVCSSVEIECEENDAADISATGGNAYAQPERLFYCQECNFGNPAIKGVLLHQSLTHKYINTSRDRVLEYTALIREEMEKSKILAKGSSTSTQLPLPLISEDDGNMLFCHLCNYRNSSMNTVVRHYHKSHHGSPAKVAHIQQYTSMVLRQVEKAPLKRAGHQEVNQESQVKMEKKKKKTNQLVKLSPPLATNSTQQKQRTLQCCKCKYSTQYVFLLRKHMRKAHHSRRSANDILKMCFELGTLQSGYHCEWCVFSHKEAAVIHKHYQEQHPGHLSSLAYVSTQLYVGPCTLRTKAKPKSADHAEGSVTAQRPGQNEMEMYSCNDCSFKSCSRSGLASHRQAVHSWSAKEDGWDLQGNKKVSAKSEVEDLSNMPGLFESFQVPPRDAEEATTACTLFKCPSCPANFSTRHGLSIHQGLKHLESVHGEDQEKRKVQTQTRVHVFKCPHCCYVNTTYQGVLTHCQMRHPALAARVDSLHVDATQLHNHDEYLKKKHSGDNLKFSGYMCKTCQKICATLDKMNKHCEREHNKTSSGGGANALKAAPKPSAVSKADSLMVSSAQRYACQHCSVICRTKIGLSHHMLLCHIDAVSKDCVYKCVLCPQFYYSKKRLERHYAKRHGKSAYLKYYVPVYKMVKKPTAPSEGHPSTQQSENSSAEDSKKLVYKCPNCPYVNTSYHGTLTHCQMKHPTTVVRANELEIGEILLADLVGCSRGRSFNERGYECKKCPQLQVSLKKLKIHYQNVHGEKMVCESHADSKRENQSSNSPNVPELNVTPLKEITPEDSIAKTIPSLPTPGESHSGSEPKKSKALYKCQMCTYTGLFRRYLHCHYKNAHKLDALSVRKLLEKYNKRKYRSLSHSDDAEKIVKCIKCPDVVFDSYQSLIDHYRTFHRLNCKSDFQVVSSGMKYNSTGVYKCAHCTTQLNGTRKLCYHLDRHREKLLETTEAAQRKPSPLCATASDAKSPQLLRQNEVPALESTHELTEASMTPVEPATQPPSLESSPSKLSGGEPEVEAEKDEGHSCNQCKKTFMSLKGLRSHERSHAAMAAIRKRDRLPATGLKHNLKNYVLHKSGTLKPFLCGCCSYRTNVLGLWRSHFLKNHQDVLQNGEAEIKNVDEMTETADEEFPDSEKMNNQFDLFEEAEESEESMYLEPPDVQRQLNHYSLMAQSHTTFKESVQKPLENSVLHCEICSFKTEHLSSIRRHYLNRHGKKMLRCKDCDFFTGSRRTLEMHVAASHHTFQSEPTHQRDLRCPLCLYQTKNKNNMIDHIVLHREERVVPIEVRRPKLSRYLEGIVFRCHKCTFTSGSAESLNLHMLRHDDVKPYKCRLCYFDCSHLRELEAHLSDKHQVLRNHELVGQVSLDQLESSTGKGTETTQQQQQQHNTDSKDVETVEYLPDHDEVPQAETLTEYDAGEKYMPNIREAPEKQEQYENKESPAEDSVLDDQRGDADPHTVGAMHELDLQTHAENLALPSAGGESSVEQTAGDGSNVSSLSDHCRSPKSEGCSKTQTNPRDQQNQKTAKGRSTYPKAEGTTEARRLHFETFQRKTLNTDERVEDDLLHHISLMDEDGSTRKMHNQANEENAVILEQDIEHKGLDNDPSDGLLLDNDDSISLDENCKSQVNANCLSASAKVSSAQATDTRPQEGLRFDKNLLTLRPIYPKLKLSHEGSLVSAFTNCKKEQEKVQKNCVKEPGPDEKMPVLEKENLKREPSALESCEEEEKTVDLEHRQDHEDEAITEDHSAQSSIQDSSHESEGASEDTNGSTGILASSCPEEKRFTCEFCGRNLMNMSELNYHVMRHGL